MVEVLYEWFPLGEGRQAENNSLWSVHEGVGGNGVDELLVEGSTVTWYQGLHQHARAVKKVFHVQGEVTKAFWCSFDDVECEKPPARCLCVCEHALLSLFMVSGATYYVPLPFPMRCVWPAPGGILVERLVEEEPGHVPCEDGLAVFFSLQHPLNDFAPITFRSRSAESLSSSVTVGYFISTRVHVVAVCPDTTPPLVTTYDESSHRHTVWTARPAGNEDIPSPVQNPPVLPSIASPHPMSSSAPARYFHHTPSTPIHFSLQLNTTPASSRAGNVQKLPKPGSRRDSLKLPVLSRVQYDSPYGVFGSGGQTGAPAAAGSSGGQSPFISRLRTPLSAQYQTQVPMRKAKSLSPPLHYARFSPFCLTHISRSISSIYPEETLGEPLEPLLPQTCFHQLWTEPAGLLLMHKAASAFLTEDFSSRQFLALVVPDTTELWLIAFTRETKDDICFKPFEKVRKVCGVVQAVGLKGQQTMLVLSSSGTVDVYSGDRKVTSLTFTLPDTGGVILSIARLRDQIGSQLTLEESTGRVFQCCVPQLAHHPAVSQCLAALQSALPSDIIVELKAAYYCFTTASPCSDSWEQFNIWLLQCLGVHHSDTQHESGSAWDEVDQLSNNACMQAAIPALALLRSGRCSRQLTKEKVVNCTQTVNLQDYCDAVTSTLHLVYEDMKLDIHRQHFLSQFASTLFKLARHLRWSSYVDHYVRDCPSLLMLSGSVTGRERGEGGDPPCVFTWIIDLLKGKQMKRFPLLNDVCHRTRQVTNMYSVIAEQRAGEGNQMLLAGGSDIDMDSDNGSVAEKIASYLIQEGLTVSGMESLSVGVALPIWCALLQCQQSPPSHWAADTCIYNLIGRDDITRTLNQSHRTHSTLSSEMCLSESDGMDFDAKILGLRFPSDLRVREVRRMLQSARPVRIALKQKPEVSDHQFVEQQETHLLMLSQRTMALPVGRGMFTMATIQPLPTVPLPVPQLNLTGKAPPRNTSVGLDHIDKPRNMTAWPEFHNGVATALQVTPESPELESSWIAFNNPPGGEDSNEHAGFLLGLGLHGHLSSLNNFNAYEYLLQKHELTVVGLLIGMGASQCGKMNLSISSLLAIFFPPLLPPDSADMEVSMLMQTAAVVGLSLLYMESANRFLVETLLKEIGHSPGPDLEFSENRESYSLTAGLALGMTALGAGDNVGLSDLNLEDKLCVYINGGAKRFVTSSTACKKGSSQLILEGERVNTHITAAGATVALGLVYLKTNNRQVAARLPIPSTQYELDLVRPDFLLLRVWCRGLILWDSIQPTEDWITSQIPTIVQKHAFQAQNKDPLIDYQTMSQVYMNILAGGCLAVGCRYAGTGNKQASSCLLQIIRQILSRNFHTSSEQASKHCIESCLCAVLLSLAVVMSGSGDLEVLKLIRRIRSQGVSHSQLTYGGYMATHMALGLLFLGGGRCTLSRSNSAIAVLVCSLYPHFPSSSTDNRYHLQALRHMYVLATELRVLVAIDSDTDTMTAVPIRVQCSQSLDYEETLHLTTPCLLPEWQSIREIEVLGPRHWSVVLDVTQAAVRNVLTKTGTVYVKKKTGYLSYEDDPQGQRSLLSLQSLSPTHYLIDGIKGTMDIPSDSVLEVGHSVVSECYRYSCKQNQHYGALLLECIARERLQLLPSLMHLEEVVISSTPSVYEVWQVKMMEAFLLSSAASESSCCGPVVARATLKLQHWIEQQWRNDSSIRDALVNYMTGVCGSLSPQTALLLVVVLLLFEVPSLRSLSLQSQDIGSILLQDQIVPPTTAARLLKLLYSY